MINVYTMYYIYRETIYTEILLDFSFQQYYLLHILFKTLKPTQVYLQ